MTMRGVFEGALREVLAAGAALPKLSDLEEVLKLSERAEERGYFSAEEDDRLCEIYAQYLRARGVLWGAVNSLQPLLKQKDEAAERGPSQAAIFGVAFCAAAMLVRSGSYLVESARKSPVLWKKLDAEESRFGIERKSFTRVYKSLSSTLWIWRYLEAGRYYLEQKDPIFETLEKEADIGGRQVMAWLLEEEEFLELRRRDFWQRRAKYKWWSFLRRNQSGYRKVMFQLFKMGGSVVAELKQPFWHRWRELQEAARTGTFKGLWKRGKKRVDQDLLESAGELLRPGDVLITRHDDAMSNLLLPGYWPHGALYIGSIEERDELGVVVDDAERARSRGVVSALGGDSFG